MGGSAAAARPNLFLSIGVLIVTVALAFGAGAIGGLYTAPETGPGGWYQTIGKPVWTPTGAVIGTVWSVLYLLMGIAAWRVWTVAPGFSWVRPLAWYAGQLLLNAAWPYVVFGQKNPLWAFGVIGVLWAAVLATLIVFWRRDRIAGLLMVPYLGWVSFAAFLNASIVALNA